MNKKHKNNIVGLFFTVLVIGLLILSGPASAINVDLITPDINIMEDNTVDFTIQVKVNSNEFLPLMYTDLILDYGDDSLICKINNDNAIDDCDFLIVTSKDIKNLDGNYGYGYGYGYGYSNGNYGYGYDSGYGYGYGYSEEIGYGTITYNLEVDVSKIPEEFLNKNIKVEARVYGGTEDNYRYFKEKSNFNVNTEIDTNPIDDTKDEIFAYNNVGIKVPAGAMPAGTIITINQVAPTANPTNTKFKILGKVY